MKLSEIVRFRNNLDEITPRDTEVYIKSDIDPIIDAMQSNEMQLPSLTQRMIVDRGNIMTSIQDFRLTLEAVKQELSRSIEAMEPTYLANSYKLYQEMQGDTSEYILDCRLNVPTSVENYLQSRIQMYSNWQSVGAVIRPSKELWIDNIVGCDPLYLIDTDHALFEPVKNKFNTSYLNRLRFYVINESDQPGMLRDLPDDQFGFVLVYNFFHYKPFDIIKNYLTEIYSKLTAGGCLAFTFNDCDRWGAVDLAEANFMCYTPGRLIRGLCENLGFEITNCYVIDNAATWMEIRKPGQRISLKGGQTLAKIIAKSK